MRCAHAMPFGTATDREGARFRLWAPSMRAVTLCLEGPEKPRELAMQPVGGGWFERRVAGIEPGTLYRFDVGHGSRVPDPASRFQPDGIHGASEVVDPESFRWTDDAWSGRPWEEAVLYEIHEGSFSKTGDHDGLRRRLDHLAALGVTALELMPVAECPGARNWGYDGVLPFAPSRRYGRPEALKRLVAEAHERELMVFLDVVYNHFGPEGNWLPVYAADFFESGEQTPWGAALGFAGPCADLVRSFFVHNALYWIEEFRMDGLRLDAVHAIPGEGRGLMLAELASEVHRCFPGRHVHLVLENDRNEASWLARDDDGRVQCYTAQWNDDVHHALHVALTGERDGFYAEYADAPLRHLGRALVEGFAWQGEPSAYRGTTRGEPSAQLPPTAFVSFLQNHDQVGNRALGERIDRLTADAALRAAVVILLLAPQIPLLFMGEEWRAAEPFPFFCDFDPELAEAIREGRRREFARFAKFSEPAARMRIPDPGSPATFAASRLDWQCRTREPNASWLRLYRELLALRQREIVPRLAGATRGGGYSLPEAGTLRAAWPLGGSAILHLETRLAVTRGAAASQPLPGDMLYATHPLDSPPPAWSVRWHLELGAGQASHA
jgi:maltooligosyltrehalose trehalohydrolase